MTGENGSYPHRRRCPPLRRTAPRQVADVVVPLFADGCAIDVILQRSVLVRIAASPDAQSVAKAIARTPLSQIPRTGHAELVAGAGASTIVAPVMLRGHLLGRMLFTSVARRYTQPDLETAESFARLAALSIQSVRRRRSEHHACQGYEQVLATVAHDLRNPLAVIQGSIALLRENATRDEAKLRFAVVERTVGFMNGLVTDLLDLASARAGALRVKSAAEKVSTLVDETVASLSVLTEPRAISVVTDHADPQAVAFCDRKRVFQVLANLLGNAIKFSRSGTSITVATRPTRKEVRVSVTDRGCGIAESDRSRVFERFWSGRSRNQGAGLGLAIAKSIVDAHGGKIGVVSRPEEGSTFWFTLPTSP